MKEKRRTIWIVVVPWDYARAEAIVFSTLKEAQEYIINEVDPKAQHYAVIQKETV